MRDMLGFASHVEVCGIAGICGICGTDHLPEIDPAGLPFLDPHPPPSSINHKTGTANDQPTKKECLFSI